MANDFAGKVAVVTGGGNGIGAATCPAFAGARVVILDRAAAAAETVARRSSKRRQRFQLAREVGPVRGYARQTEQQCAACHNGFPELTPYGRQFKLNGYTGTGGTSNLPPIAVMAIRRRPFRHRGRTVAAGETYPERWHPALVGRPDVPALASAGSTSLTGTSGTGGGFGG